MYLHWRINVKCFLSWANLMFSFSHLRQLAAVSGTYQPFIAFRSDWDEVLVLRMKGLSDFILDFSGVRGTASRGRTLLPRGRPVGRAPQVPNVQQGVFKRYLRAIWPTAASMNELRNVRKVSGTIVLCENVFSVNYGHLFIPWHLFGISSDIKNKLIRKFIKLQFWKPVFLHITAPNA